MLAKKITTIALVLNVLCFSATINAQDLKYKDFDFTKEPPVVKLSDTEKKESAVILEEKRGMQYAYNEKGELGFYYFRFKSIVLLEDKAIESFNKIYLPITDQKYILSLKARSISPAGKIKVFGKEDIKEIEEAKAMQPLRQSDFSPQSKLRMVKEQFTLVRRRSAAWRRATRLGEIPTQSSFHALWRTESLTADDRAAPHSGPG